MQQKTFVDDKTFSNLEIGAGCGNFGKIYYPLCYLIDSDEELRSICEICYIDLFCDVNKLIWKNDRFDKIIMCNPDGYGFRDDEMTDKLMKELLRVLKGKGSKIIIICGKISSFCNPKRVTKRIATFLEKNKSVNLIVECQEINAAIEYNNYIFKQTLGDQTFPSSKIIIHVE
jgi:ubiquinone/menaquinone biosynthesis C-methylase UbiE